MSERTCKHCKATAEQLGPIGMWQHCPEHEGGSLTHEWHDPASARLRIVTDDDGHWYLIPAERREEFDEWLGSEAAMDGEELPWAERLNMHPSNHSFTGWREDK